MFGKRLQELNEADLQKLCDEAVPEGLTLEFKRELNLSDEKEKRKAAKAVSALANNAGGRLIYGIEERQLHDGSLVAGKPKPMTDGTISARLADILHSAIHPRPQFDMREVQFEGGGHVLVLEVSPSLGLDLHMVTAYGEHRFYTRGSKGVVPMTEPEVRAAYTRIAEHRASLEARVEALTVPELERRSSAAESILVVPLFATNTIVDPRQVRELKLELQKALPSLWDRLRELPLEFDGYRRGPSRPGDGPYIAILKTGVVHYSDPHVLTKSQPPIFSALIAARRILEALVMAHKVYQLCAYSGPVRVTYRLQVTQDWQIEDSRPPLTIPTRSYSTEIPGMNLEESIGRWGHYLKDLLDPLFHAAGVLECHHFTSGGLLRKADARHLRGLEQYVLIEP